MTVLLGETSMASVVKSYTGWSSPSNRSADASGIRIAFFYSAYIIQTPLGVVGLS